MSLEWQSWPVPFSSNSDRLRAVAEEFEFLDDDVIVSTFMKCGTTLTLQLAFCLLHGADAAEAAPLDAQTAFLELELPPAPPRGPPPAQAPPQGPPPAQAPPRGPPPAQAPPQGPPPAQAPPQGHPPAQAPPQGPPDQLQLAASLPRPRLLKTHLPPAFHLRHLRRSRGPRCVVVMRNPKDALVSAFHHLGASVHPGLRVPASFSEFLRAALLRPDQLGLHDFFDFSLSWWSFRQHPRVLVLFYEELVRDKEAQTRRLAEFLGVEADDRRLLEAVEASSFRRMQQSGSTNVTLRAEAEGVWKPGFSFVRSGTVGGWRRQFSVADSEFADDVIRRRLAGADLKFEFE